MLRETFSNSGLDYDFTYRPHSPATLDSALDGAIALASAKLLGLQSEPGYWVFELEADCTISAEYILMMHFMDEIDPVLQSKIANYLRAHQLADGGFPLYAGGAGDISCGIKAYYAMKMAGDSLDAPHMIKARNWILAKGGAAKANVFTRIMLAMFEQMPWRATPFLPVEIMLLPKWFPFHLDKVSYWSRTVMVPLLILCTYKVKARNPGKFGVAELFLISPDEEKNYFSHVKTPLGKAILLLDRAGLRIEPLIPAFIRRLATAKARDWFMARLNGYDGLGAIFTAMVNAYAAMDYLGLPGNHEKCRIARAAIDRLLVIQDNVAYCQPCVSPVWDTGLMALILQEISRHDADTKRAVKPALNAALHWLTEKQLRDEPGDWQKQRPNLPGGGWAFQFSNSYYPDLDDTAVVALSLVQADNPKFLEPITRAGDWIAGMQSKNGGFGAFDADNDHLYLNHIPFADHGALLDPPTADVSGRCLMFLSQRLNQCPEYRPVIEKCLLFLRKQQKSDGSWYGRWGSNYIYGTWSVLTGFENAGIAKSDPDLQKAVHWLKSIQHTDGGWGESNDSYLDTANVKAIYASTAFHTALAVLALLAAGEAESPEARGGVKYLLKNQEADGFWKEPSSNAPGFPKFLYLKYHGYSKFFPLWALARYRNRRLSG